MKAIVIGGTGAVGSVVVHSLAQDPSVSEVRCLVRRKPETNPIPGKISYFIVDLFDSNSYTEHIARCDAAFIMLGVGQPSQVSKEELLRTDFQAPLAFAKVCREKNVSSISVLTAVLASAESGVDYLRIKGELESNIEAMKFRGTFFYQPSMLMTKTNRYDWKQGLLLKIYPILDHLLLGPLKIYRSISVEELGRCMAKVAMDFAKKSDRNDIVRRLTWADFKAVNHQN